MATVKKGILAASLEWARHLRPFYKRRFWRKHRRAETSEAKTQLHETHHGRRPYSED